VLFSQPLVVYFVDSKNLRHFPSPPLAAISSLWRIFHNLHHNHYLAVHNAHKELGTHVRIAPKHISVSDPAAMNDIYGHGANFLKDAWYDGGAGEFRHMADARVKLEHQQKRKLLAHVFAQKTIANLEPVISDTIAVLLARVAQAADSGKTINMRRYLNYFTIDVFSRLLYGESQGCIERGNDMVNAQTEDGKIYQAPFIKSLHDATIMNTILGMEAGILPLTRRLLSWHPYKKAGADYDNIIYYNTLKKFNAKDADADDIFSKLLVDNKGAPLGLKLGEVLAECSVMMNAGTDTTTAALTNAIYLLYKNPTVLKRLREEVDEATGTNPIAPYETLAKLPYLRACVEESLRCRPASTMGLPRVVPKGGRMVAGQFIDEDVTVSVPTYTLLRNPEAFDNPEEFRPERWLAGEEEKARMSKAHFPFSTGPRACIGRNIAYFEQLIVIAALVKAFDFTFEAPDFRLRILERFNGNPDEMVMAVQRRQVF
jgi:benzoate 4-monooxygenase